MKLVRIILLLNIIYKINSNKELIKYPTKRWIRMCNSSNVTSFYKKSTSSVRDFFQTNGFDVLYM